MMGFVAESRQERDAQVRQHEDKMKREKVRMNKVAVLTIDQADTVAFAYPRHSHGEFWSFPPCVP
jgi:hypothetical protein